MAEAFSRTGVPVFAADVKGDLSGISQAGKEQPQTRRAGQETWSWETSTTTGCPVTFWDVFGEQGHPVRATVSEMGPLLFSRLLNLNDTQAGVLDAGFQDRRRQRPAAARSERPAGDAAARGRQRQRLADRVRQHFRGEHRRDPARAADAGAAGRRQVLWRAGAEYRRPDADRRQRPWRREHSGRGQADDVAASLRDVSACGCCRNCSRSCRKSAIRTNRSWCSSSTKPTCCLPICRRYWKKRSSRWCG